MKKTNLIFILSFFLLIIGCHKTTTTLPNHSGYSVWDIIEKTEARAPKGLTGEFKLHLKNNGKQSSNIYLNTQEDYRDRRNITVTLLPSFQHAFTKKHGVDIRNFYKNQTVLVRGEAKRVKIWFNSHSMQPTKYYFQTHIIVSDLNQITVLNQPKESQHL